MKIENFVEIFEQDILAAMDKSASENLGIKKGWVDKNLPEFLPAIRKQAETIYSGGTE